MTGKSELERRRVAFHEAGHLVAAWRSGFDVRYATSRARTRGVAGRVVRKSCGDTYRWWDEGVLAAAGMAAELGDLTERGVEVDQHARNQMVWCARGDNTNLFNACEQGLDTESSRSEVLPCHAPENAVAAQVWTDTVALVSREWGAVTALADRFLTDRRTLTGREAFTLADQAPSKHIAIPSDWWVPDHHPRLWFKNSLVWQLEYFARRCPQHWRWAPTGLAGTHTASCGRPFHDSEYDDFKVHLSANRFGGWAYQINHCGRRIEQGGRRSKTRSTPTFYWPDVMRKALALSSAEG